MAQGRITLLAFRLPDMSCNRETLSTAEETRKGMSEWGVAAFQVRDIPPREQIPHQAHWYTFLARHVPVPGNYAHCEVRVWRVEGGSVLITPRQDADFGEGDPDRDCQRGLPEDMLDPDFHLRWRKRLAKRSQLVLGPREQNTADGVG